MLYNIITLCLILSYSFITHGDIFEKYKKTSPDTSETLLPIRASVNSEILAKVLFLQNYANAFAKGRNPSDYVGY